MPSFLALSTACRRCLAGYAVVDTAVACGGDAGGPQASPRGFTAAPRGVSFTAEPHEITHPSPDVEALPDRVDTHALPGAPSP